MKVTGLNDAVSDQNLKIILKAVFLKSHLFRPLASPNATFFTSAIFRARMYQQSFASSHMGKYKSYWKNCLLN